MNQASDFRIVRDLFRKATQLARERTDQALSKHGVHVGQQFVLETLWQEDGLTPGELSRRIGVATPTVVKSVGRMEAAGLLTRKDDPADGRLVRVWLTNAGRNLREIVPQLERDVIEEGLLEFSDEERRQFINLLSRVVKNLDAD